MSYCSPILYQLKLMKISSIILIVVATCLVATSVSFSLLVTWHSPDAELKFHQLEFAKVVAAVACFFAVIAGGICIQILMEDKHAKELETDRLNRARHINALECKRAMEKRKKDRFNKELQTAFLKRDDV